VRAIKAGRISATRDDLGQWQIDPAELFRVFPALAIPGATPQTPPIERDATTDMLVAELRQVISDLAAGPRPLAHCARTRAGRQCRHATAAVAGARNGSGTGRTGGRGGRNGTQTPRNRLVRAWRWMRATGCLAGAGLLLVLATGAARAQQQQQQPPPQQQQPPGCFTVEMSHSTQGNPQGSILLDRCSGKTWLLLCIRNDNAGCAFRWAPIPDATEPAGGP
jgi:hypothetical protein